MKAKKGQTKQSAKDKKKSLKSQKEPVETSNNNEVSPIKSKKALNKKGQLQEKNSKLPGDTPVLPKAPSWSLTDLQTLVDRLDNVLSSDDQMKFMKREQTIDWKKICFGSHTPTDCQDAWIILRNKQRMDRTFEDMLKSAEEYLSNVAEATETSKTSGSPEASKTLKPSQTPKAPKSPGTPQRKEALDYFAMEVREAVKAKNPGAKKFKIRKIIKLLYKELPEKKKQKYIQMAEAQSEGLNGKAVAANVRNEGASSSDEEMESE